jgi:molybdate transport system permease protein
MALFDHVEAFNYQQAHFLAAGLMLSAMILLSLIYLLNRQSTVKSS